MAPGSGGAGVADAGVVDDEVDAGREIVFDKNDAEGRDAGQEAIAGTGDIEEGRDAYKPGGLHPVYIGDVYASKYEVISKLGWGRIRRFGW
jgi:hypothetical protein